MFRSGKSIVLPTVQHVWCQKLMTTAISVSKFKFRTSVTQWPLPSQIFLSPLHCLCWLWCVLVHESKFSWLICCVQWCWSIQVFIFFSTVASVDNGSIRADIFAYHLGCLKVQKLDYNLQCIPLVWATHANFFQCHRHLEDRRHEEGYFLLIHFYLYEHLSILRWAPSASPWQLYVWLWRSDCSFTQHILHIHQSGCITILVIWLVPLETAAVSAQVPWTPYSHAPWIHACLAVTCHQYFWQNDQIFYILLQ